MFNVAASAQSKRQLDRCTSPQEPHHPTATKAEPPKNRNTSWLPLDGIFMEPSGHVGVGPQLLAGQLRQLGDGCLVVIDPGGHHVRGSFGTQVITELAGALLLAGLRPPILDPDAGRLEPSCRSPLRRYRCL